MRRLGLLGSGFFLLLMVAACGSEGGLDASASSEEAPPSGSGHGEGVEGTGANSAGGARSGEPSVGTTNPETNDDASPTGSTPKSDSGSSDAGTSGDANVDATDASTDGATPMDAASTDAAPAVFVPNAKRVFETSGTFSGDLKTEGWGQSGLEGGDNLCNSAALVANLGGTWRAWLSAPGANAVDRIVDVSPWYFVDKKTMVFEKKVGLAKGSVLPQVPGIHVGPFVDISMNEHGVANSPVRDAWTGTEERGLVSPWNCVGWTDGVSYSGLTGMKGDSYAGFPVNLSWWTDSMTSDCYHKQRLICFEQ